MQKYSFSLFPGCCILCQQPAGRELDLCNACEADLPWLTVACSYCGLPLAHNHDLCAMCIKRPPVFSAVLCGFQFCFPVDSMIRRFKDQRNLASGYVLAKLLLSRHRAILQSLSGSDTTIFPVPLHWTAKRKRGFNQSLIIAEVLASGLDCEIDTRSLTRVSRSKTQKNLSQTERKQNLRGVFACTKNLKGQRIILVDDVITTTSTISEITQLLGKKGAADVVAVALARTPANRLSQ